MIATSQHAMSFKLQTDFSGRPLAVIGAGMLGRSR